MVKSIWVRAVSCQLQKPNGPDMASYEMTEVQDHELVLRVKRKFILQSGFLIMAGVSGESKMYPERDGSN